MSAARFIVTGRVQGVAFGARALRTRFLFPGAAYGFSWERTFSDGPDRMTLKVGARVAFDLDL